MQRTYSFQKYCSNCLHFGSCSKCKQKIEIQQQAPQQEIKILQKSFSNVKGVNFSKSPIQDENQIQEQSPRHQKSKSFFEKNNGNFVIKDLNKKLFKQPVSFLNNSIKKVIQVDSADIEIKKLQRTMFKLQKHIDTNPQFKLIKSINIHQNSITKIIQQDNKIYTSSLDKSVNILNLDNNQNEKIQLKAKVQTLYPFKSCILIAADKQIYVYKNLQKIKMVKFHEGPVTDITNLQNFVVSSSFDVKIWDINNLEVIYNWNNDVRQTKLCMIQQSYFLSGDTKGFINSYDIRQNKIIKDFEHDDCINEIVKVDDNQIISSSQDGLIKIWDIRNKKEINRFEAQAVKSIICSGKQILVILCKIEIESFVQITYIIKSYRFRRFHKLYFTLRKKIIYWGIFIKTQYLGFLIQLNYYFYKLKDMKEIIFTCFSALCLTLTYIFSFLQVYRHYKNYSQPQFQDKIIIILLMAPVYGTFSCLSMWIGDHTGYLIYIRDIYESIVIYSFFKLLYYFICWDADKKRTDKEKIYEALKAEDFHGHSFPFNLFCSKLDFSTRDTCHKAFWQIRDGILQYVFIKMSITAIDLFDLWLWDWLPFSHMIYYIAATIASVSVSMALYYLVLFFHTLHKPLEKYKPLAKFLTIKGILFITFWQEVIIYFCESSLSHSKFLPKKHREVDAELYLSSILVTFEMLILSLLTNYAYSYKDYQNQKVKKE